MENNTQTVNVTSLRMDFMDSSEVVVHTEGTTGNHSASGRLYLCAFCLPDLQ